MLTESEIIKGCKDFNGLAQKLLYQKYASSMRMVCLRYCKDKDEAKDVLQEGFIKIFSQIDKFNGSGPIEGWMKKIIINTAISNYRQSKKYMYESISSTDVQENDESYSSKKYIVEEHEEISVFSEATFTHEELLEALDSLPETYRLVFNMYHLEEFSHAEIAKSLGMDEKTSRTRLFRAKKLLQEYLQQLATRKIDF